MTKELNWAFATAAKADCPPDDWKRAETILLEAQFCPRCATEGDHLKLGPHEDATHETYAGRECYTCEEFFPDPRQPVDGYEREDYGGVLAADGMVYSDADPGL